MAVRKFLSFVTLAAFGLALAATARAATFPIAVNPVSSDGAGKDLQTQLSLHGIGSNVTTDQVNAYTFLPCAMGGTPHMEVLFQIAGNAPYHEIGYYQPTGTASAPTYVVGGSSSGLPYSADYAPAFGPFGLALNTPGGPFYSEANLNTDGFSHAVVLKDKDAQGNTVDCSYIVAWEDLPYGGDTDYNDIVIRVSGVTSVPEPGAVAMLAGLGLSGAGLLIRRRRCGAKA